VVYNGTVSIEVAADVRRQMLATKYVFAGDHVELFSAIFLSSRYLNSELIDKQEITSFRFEMTGNAAFCLAFGNSSCKLNTFRCHIQ